MRWRSQAIEACKNGNYDMAINSLAAINALMPAGDEADGSDGFKVEISTEKFNAIMRERRFIICNFCETEEVIIQDGKPKTTGEMIPTECVLSDVVQYDLELGWQEQILSGKKTERVWICTKCKETNDMDLKKIKIRKYQEPFYTKIIPSPPIQERGVRGRSIYPKLFNVWFGIAVAEIENQISLYRTQYAAENDDEEEVGGDD